MGILALELEIQTNKMVLFSHLRNRLSSRSGLKLFSSGEFFRESLFKDENDICASMGSLSNCRFYENQFPAIDELVVVQVRQIAEMGAYVKLLEYDNIEGMILLSELSRRRIRSINKLIRVGRNEVVVVLRVDQEKGCPYLLFSVLSNRIH